MKLQDLSDGALAARCSARPPDDDAWQELYRRYHRLIQWQVARLVQDEHSEVADDLSAEIVEKLYREIHKYNPTRGRLASFIATVARNHILDFRRKAKSEASYTMMLDQRSWDALSSPVLQQIDLEAEITKYILAAIHGQEVKEVIFDELVAGKNPHNIATEHNFSHKVVYRVKAELLDLVKACLDSFSSNSAQ